MSKIIDNPMTWPEYTPFREDEFDERRPDFEPGFNERGRFDMVGYAYKVCGFPSKHGRSIDDPTIDHYEERLIEERRAG